MNKIIIKSGGKRIDKYLADESILEANVTRGEIARQIKAGRILVNGKKIKPSYMLRVGDELTVDFPENDKDIFPNPDIGYELSYEDEDIIVVNKPAGLQVHPDRHERKNTLVNGLLFKYPQLRNIGEDGDRPGIVHRLDKDTSGIMVIANNQKVFLEMKRKFKDREIEKKYWAVVCGMMKGDGVIDKPIARSSRYKKQVVAGKKTSTKIREAITEYKVLKTGNELSLVQLTPKTGRMHQLRVHLSSIGHPIVGDKLYGKRRQKNKEMVFRHMLHAKNLKFTLFEKHYSFEAPLPTDISDFVAKLD